LFLLNQPKSFDIVRTNPYKFLAISATLAA